MKDDFFLDSFDSILWKIVTCTLFEKIEGSRLLPWLILLYFDNFFDRKWIRGMLIGGCKIDGNN